MKISWWRGREKGESTLFKIVILLLSCVWLCNPMDYSTPHSPVLHYLPEFAQIHIHWVSDVTPSTWGAHLLVSYLFAFSYSSWSSHGKNTAVVCHSLLQWTTFCQNPSLWPIHLEWHCTAWLTALLSYTSPCTTIRLWSMKGFFKLMFS